MKLENISPAIEALPVQTFFLYVLIFGNSLSQKYNILLKDAHSKFELVKVSEIQ